MARVFQYNQNQDKYEPTNTIALASQKGFGLLSEPLSKSLMEALENVQGYYYFYFQMDNKVARVFQYNQN